MFFYISSSCFEIYEFLLYDKCKKFNIIFYTRGSCFMPIFIDNENCKMGNFSQKKVFSSSVIKQNLRYIEIVKILLYKNKYDFYFF